MTFIFACGGTGGHIFPALSVGEELRRREPRSRILYVCGKKDIESAIFSVARQEQVVPIEIEPLRGGLSFLHPVFLWKLTRGFFQSLSLIRRERPSLVVGFGGYVSFPVIAAAKCCGVPTMIHEQNVLPGKANRLLSTHVDAVALSFPETQKSWRLLKNVLVTGNPIRSAIERECRPEALSFFGFSKDKKTLLVLGGSQGAESINTLFLGSLAHLPVPVRERLQVLHLCGRMSPRDSDAACRAAGVGGKAFAFFDRMDLAYAAADLCIGRAGATFLAEVRTKNIPVLLVPYPFGDGHQRANAEVYSHLIGARVVEQKELDAPKLAQILEQMIKETSAHHAGSADRSGAQPNARIRLAEFIGQCASAPLKTSPVRVGGAR
jgi:UDP-N-acetylglucosamine--N-acetylmuramyl-(pentapeptide) pyrophosphoryl-undecaprenol N-acetylglucosamine transferase